MTLSTSSTLSESSALPTSPPRRVSASGVGADQLRSIIERVEKLEEEKAEIASDIKDLYAESKGAGFCPKTLRKVIALRKLDAAARDEADHMLDTYLVALGMKPQLELFEEEK